MFRSSTVALLRRAAASAAPQQQHHMAASLMLRSSASAMAGAVRQQLAAPSSLLMTVVFSRLNSEMTLSPDRSENGKNFARKSKILPQKTVFWERDKRRSKSVENFEKFFLGLFLFLV